METHLSKLIEETLSLDQKATPGPWKYQVEYSNRCLLVYQPPGLEPQVLGAVYCGIGGHDANENSSMLAHYRTSAPRLARIVKVMEEALKSVLMQEHGSWDAQAVYVQNQLAEANRIAKGET